MDISRITTKMIAFVTFAEVALAEVTSLKPEESASTNPHTVYIIAMTALAGVSMTFVIYKVFQERDEETHSYQGCPTNGCIHSDK